MAELSRFQRSRSGEAAQRARSVEFPIALRGYDRQAVDEYVEEMARLLDSLEATQARETVVQRALDEVGEQTSGILQRAHETAEEITARSRAKAEGRLQRAEREAELLRRDADEYAERLVSDTRVLWEERQRLIEEMRQLADEVLGAADDAIERLPEPELLRRRPPDPGDEPGADPTAVMPALDETAGPPAAGDEIGLRADRGDGPPAAEPGAGPVAEDPADGDQPTQEVEVPWLDGGDPEQPRESPEPGGQEASEPAGAAASEPGEPAPRDGTAAGDDASSAEQPRLGEQAEQRPPGGGRS